MNKKELIDKNMLLNKLRACRVFHEDTLKDCMEIKAVRAIVDAQQVYDNVCDLCRFGPPSSCDGKPCTMCPAESKIFED